MNPVHCTFIVFRFHRICHCPTSNSERSVGSGGGKGSGSQTDPLVGGVEDGVETLKEGLAVDEVETLAGVSAEVTDDEVHAVGIATNSSVEVTLQITRSI